MNQVVFYSVELVSSQHTTHIYVYSFETTITFMESCIQRKYHQLVPDPLWPDIHVPTTLVMPFNSLDFVPTFASDECSYLALSNMGSIMLQVSDICNANINPLDEIPLTSRS